MCDAHSHFQYMHHLQCLHLDPPIISLFLCADEAQWKPSKCKSNAPLMQFLVGKGCRPAPQIAKPMHGQSKTMAVVVTMALFNHARCPVLADYEMISLLIIPLKLIEQKVDLALHAEHLTCAGIADLLVTNAPPAIVMLLLSRSSICCRHILRWWSDCRRCYGSSVPAAASAAIP